MDEHPMDKRGTPGVAIYFTEPTEVQGGEATLVLDLTEIGGSDPQLLVNAQGRDAVTDSWEDLASFPQIASLGEQRLTVPTASKSSVRLRLQLAGSDAPMRVTLKGLTHVTGRCAR
jgi:hypothetical protein